MQVAKRSRPFGWSSSWLQLIRQVGAGAAKSCVGVLLLRGVWGVRLRLVGSTLIGKFQLEPSIGNMAAIELLLIGKVVRARRGEGNCASVSLCNANYLNVSSEMIVARFLRQNKWHETGIIRTTAALRSIDAFNRFITRLLRFKKRC